MEPERLNEEVVQLLNLDNLMTRAISLYESITRLLSDFDAYAHTNTTPKWEDVVGKYSMVNVELLILVEEVKEVSKAFVVFPKNVTANNAASLPVMLATKLLPEMETDNNLKREQLLQGVQSLPVPTQIEKLKGRIGKITEACESMEKVLADARKAYGLGPRGDPYMFPTMDKGQVAKIKEQESMLRAAVNEGAGIRLPPDQRQITTALPPHLVDLLLVNDAQGSPSGQMQYGVSGTSPQRSQASQGDQMFNSNGMMQTQQSQSQQPGQEQQHQGDDGNMHTNQQNLQPNMLENAQQRHQNPQ